MKYIVTRTIVATISVDADNVEDAITHAEEAGDWEWDAYSNLRTQQREMKGNDHGISEGEQPDRRSA